MEYIAGITDFKFKNSAVTLGKFDGIHLGHQYLIEKVISYKEQGYKAIMFSFLYHPSTLFSDKEFEQIYTEEEKRAKLENSGLDVLVAYPFTQETRSIEPEDFIKEILVDKLDAKVIVVGNDFRFGYKRRGDIELLQQYADVYGYKVIACEKKKWGEHIISSSLIRNELKEGNMEMVNAMLGQPYSIRGEVLHGRRIGRTLGMPTTNITPPTNKLLPPCGVYPSKTLIDHKYYYGVTNIGYKPTVGAEEKKGVETFLFDFDQDLYGKIIEVELMTYVRPELKFNTLEELREKMQEDIIKARKYFHLEG
ncbi:MAG: bifunctional riboflavin kinase/FAD synthetase [Clostridiales bacterium]|jgi:riboflavin kinase/FMN adenylyltransferase|nr:bifunctional riboflavin kinase/FAD synthetase [Clostridiales bacterium]